MFRILGPRALGAFVAGFLVIAAVLLGCSQVSAQAKPGGAHGRTLQGDDPFIALPVPGLPDQMVWTIAFDQNDHPWVGTNRGGATQREDGAWQLLTAYYADQLLISLALRANGKV